jgi:hypothetical protein
MTSANSMPVLRTREARYIQFDCLVCDKNICHQMEGRDLITRLPGSTDYRQGTVKSFAPRTAMELAESREGVI